eukprot:4196662-Prymnesium_polylepis.2
MAMVHARVAQSGRVSCPSTARSSGFLGRLTLLALSLLFDRRRPWRGLRLLSAATPCSRCASDRRRTHNIEQWFGSCAHARVVLMPLSHSPTTAVAVDGDYAVAASRRARSRRARSRRRAAGAR